MRRVSFTEAARLKGTIYYASPKHGLRAVDSWRAWGKHYRLVTFCDGSECVLPKETKLEYERRTARQR